MNQRYLQAGWPGSISHVCNLAVLYFQVYDWGASGRAVHDLGEVVLSILQRIQLYVVNSVAEITKLTKL